MYTKRYRELEDILFRSKDEFVLKIKEELEELSSYNTCNEYINNITIASRLVEGNTYVPIDVFAISDYTFLIVVCTICNTQEHQVILKSLSTRTFEKKWLCKWSCKVGNREAFLHYLSISELDGNYISVPEFYGRYDYAILSIKQITDRSSLKIQDL